MAFITKDEKERITRTAYSNPHDLLFVITAMRYSLIEWRKRHFGCRTEALYNPYILVVLPVHAFCTSSTGRLYQL